MSVPLLASKIRPPVPGLHWVPRPHLVQRLDDGLRLGRRLSLVVGPPGSGKSSLIGEWAHALDRPVAWLGLDEGDNLPAQFMRYVIAALQQAGAAVGANITPILESSVEPPLSNVMALLLNELAALSDPPVLVLDDYQAIANREIHLGVELLVDNQPRGMHVAILSRQDPPLAVPRWRARGQLTELRADDLSFSEEEARQFLNDRMGLALTPRSIGALEVKTEGWIAGLQLAGLALQREKDPDGFVASFTGIDRYVMDYLVAEVLDRQPDDLREFLRRTALLDRLTAPLCDALTGREDSQALLGRIEEANLFLIPLDNRREWYRYHPLFSDVLRSRLDADEQVTLHALAARWYDAHGLAPLAVQHALSHARLSGDTGLAEDVVLRASDALMDSSGLPTVRRWLDALPDERVRVNWKLATYRGWLLALSGEIDLAGEYARAAEERAGGEDGPPADAGKLRTLRAFLALFRRRDFEEAIELAAPAIPMLETAPPHWRVTALWVLAEAQERARPITEAIETFREARRVGLAAGQQLFVATAEAWLAAALNSHGKLRDALRVCEEAIGRYTDRNGEAAPVATLPFNQLARCHYDRNELELSLACHEKAAGLAAQFGIAYHARTLRGLSAPTLHALGRGGEALVLLEDAYRSSSEADMPEAHWYLAWDITIRLQQGDVPTARERARAAGLSPDDALEYLRIDLHLAYGRLLLAEGRLAEARRWLARLQAFFEERQLFRLWINARILQALRAEAEGDRPAAVGALSDALRLAAPEGYLRAFLEEGGAAMSLLPAVRHVEPEFVRALLEPSGRTRPATGAGPLVEPLSERELEVLRLIAQGLTNQEIAARLYLSVPTIKWHTGHIFGKLDVKSRTAAAARAQELGLLDPR